MEIPQKGVIVVEDLLSSPALQLRLLAGQSGTTRRVTWAHVSELEDPTPWLFGSELIMTTGIAIPKSAERQCRYLERLDEAGVACLAISEGLFSPPISPRLLAVANERGFPILEVPIPVPFIAIAQEVAAAVQAVTGQRLYAQLQVFGAVRWLAEGDLSTSEIFKRLEQLSGYALYACTLRRTPLLDGVPVPPDRYADLVPQLPTSPPSVPGGYVLPVLRRRGTAGYVLAMEVPGKHSAGLSVVQHIATVAALQLSMIAHDRELQRREGAEALSGLLSGVVLDRDVVARRLVANGFGVSEPLVLAIVHSVGDADDEVIDALAQLDLPHLILRQQSELFLLLPERPDVRSILSAWPNAGVGMSRPFPMGAPILLARREAHRALSQALDSGRSLVSFGDDRTSRWIVDDKSELEALVQQVLGASIAYDTTHHGDLVMTVQTWLEHDRQTEPTALALNIHPNTLMYRVHRFEEISGYSLSSTEGLTEVWLALRSRGSVPHASFSGSEF
jgi:purine catabolism regulator